MGGELSQFKGSKKLATKPAPCSVIFHQRGSRLVLKRITTVKLLVFSMSCLVITVLRYVDYIACKT